MAVEVPVAEFIDENLHHDGSEQWWSSLAPMVMSRRGHHVQECVDACFHLGYHATPFELVPQVKAPKSSNPLVQHWDRKLHEVCLRGPVERFDLLLERYQGVMECLTLLGQGHALYFNRGYVVDPDDGQPTHWVDHFHRRRLKPFCLWVVGRRA